MHCNKQSLPFRSCLKRIVVLFFWCLALCLAAGEGTNSGIGSGNLSADQLLIVPEAYRKAALRLILEEANRVARDLRLAEQLPITDSNLVEYFVCPPLMARLGIGNITTSNFNYSIAAGNKFSFLTRMGSNKDYDNLEGQYKWPLNRIDTNAAYQLSTQWLAAVSVDVERLNRECQLSIRPWIPGRASGHFVPLYWVFWSQAAKTVATVELILPTKSIRQLRINKSEYILRKPVDVKSLEPLAVGQRPPLPSSPPRR